MSNNPSGSHDPILLSDVANCLRFCYNAHNEPKDFFEEISKIHNDEERIHRIYKLLVFYQLATKYDTVIKDDSSANIRLGFSIECFKQKFFMGGHDWSNRALKCAVGREKISEAYTERSHNSFFMGQYVDCISDIDRVLDVAPNLTMEEMMSTRRECEDILSSENFQERNAIGIVNGGKKEYMSSELFRRPAKCMTNMPCASASIKISRHHEVTAIEDIPAGKILVVEEPYVTLVDDDTLYTRCSYCCTINYAMMPCPTCRDTMYCNENCWQKSWDEGHKFECPIRYTLRIMKIKPAESLPLRILMKAKCQFQSWALLLKTIGRLEMISEPKLKGFYHKLDGDLSHYGCKYFPIHFFQNKPNEIQRSQLISNSVLAAFFIFMLREHSQIFTEYSEETGMEKELEDEDIWRIGGLLYRGLCASKSEASQIMSYSKANIRFTNEFQVGLGCFAFSNIFNHSSNANAGHIFQKNRISIIASKPIKKGEKVNLYYKPTSPNKFFDRNFELFLMDLVPSNLSSE